MTIHASKGLEFEHVFVPALEDGLLPFTLYEDKRSPLSSERIEEEQRLLYVAMTRAKTGLYLSWAKKRLLQGRILENEPSRFFNKLEALIPLAKKREHKEKKQQPQEIQPALF